MKSLTRKLLKLLVLVHLVTRTVRDEHPCYTAGEIEFARLFPNIDFCVWIAGAISFAELPEARESLLNTIKGVEDF